MNKGVYYETSNKIRPVIGVVTPYLRSFEQWKSDIGFKTYGEGAKFIQIRRMEDVIGRKYFTIEKGYKYYEMDSAIYDAAVLRVRLWVMTNESKNEEAPDIY